MAGNRSGVRRVAAAGLVLVTAACAPRAIVLPEGAGEPMADAAGTLAAATVACRTIRTYTAELGLSGRAGHMRVRGRALVGLAAPAAVRLEGLAPFGPPAFILVAHDGDATLLLPRDARVLVGADPAAMLEALTGLALDPERLRAVLSGCVATEPEARIGRMYPGGWHAIDLQDGSVTYLRSVDRELRIVAAALDGFIVEYGEWLVGLPQRVRVRTSDRRQAPDGPEVDVTVRVAQLEVNTPLDSRAFELDLPDDLWPLTLDELRAAGPLGARDP